MVKWIRLDFIVVVVVRHHNGQIRHRQNMAADVLVFFFIIPSEVPLALHREGEQEGQAPQRNCCDCHAFFSIGASKTAIAIFIRGVQ